MKFLKIAVSLAALSIITGCGYQPGAVTKGAVAGGVGGAAVGAGTGALIASIIPNGTIGASALLGGGIGLPVGMVLGAMYVKSHQDTELEKNAKRIEENRRQIIRRQEEIDQIRQQHWADTTELNPDTDRREYMYQGASLGNYYR